MTVGDDGHHHSGQLWIEQRELEGDHGWAMVFSPGVDAVGIRRRTSEMADIARKRMELIDRILARRNA